MQPLSPMLTQAPPGSRALRAASDTPAEVPDPVDVKGEERESGRSPWLMRGLALAGLVVVAATMTGCTTEDSKPVSNGLFNEGYADPQGVYYDGIGAKLGTVRANGDVTEYPFGNYIGHVSDEGRVKGFLLPVGSVSPDGVVRNGLGLRVGSVQGQDPNRVEPIEKAGAALLLLHED